MQPMSELDAQSLRDYYRRFARFEATDTSPTYTAWAQGVAEDDEIIHLLLELPKQKRQANLLFAAARHLGAGDDSNTHPGDEGNAGAGDYASLRRWLLEHWEVTREIMLARSTQTNEAGRCAVLLPALAQIDRSISLIEVGASAGLCLYPDRYSYVYGTPSGPVTLHPDDGPSPVVLDCELRNAQVPDRLPEVAWRAGIDLNPLDINDADQRNWLRSLIWPEHDIRRRRLSAAASLMGPDPPRLVAGDLLESIGPLMTEAPADSQVVVFHSAVLAYVSPAERAQFVELMRSHEDVVWISNEGARVLPDIGNQVPNDPDGRFVLAVNGEASALTGPHGQSYEGL
ncbi:DUF2332 domain-containing protein [Brevibacterium marinum]|uniref:DUF2332 domain-containing protein n=1 Tax=Brevibacterium marinum TaxID=418643 RepID=A0A846RX71_9MICO|nr:DUF2332 domain-containing protein [Brevibacterium marinum]NJC55700.1 hypothetical protein [Brevibacterium marinum]